MAYENILYAVQSGVARITLNRPDKLNSFTSAMHAELRAALDERGITLEAVFPLLVLAEANPPLNQQSEPALALLHTDEAAAVYWISPEGDRHASFFDGPTARERVLQELITGFAAFAGQSPPVFAVVNAGATPLPLLPKPVSKRYWLAPKPPRTTFTECTLPKEY